MKNIKNCIAAFLLIAFTGCNGIKTYTPSEIKEQGEKLEGKKVYVEGEVIRVAYPTGKGLLLADEKDKTVIKVSVGGKVESFNPRLMGNNINLKGIVKKHEITKADVLRMDSLIAKMDTMMPPPMKGKPFHNPNDSCFGHEKKHHHPDFAEKDSACYHKRPHHPIDADSLADKPGCPEHKMGKHHGDDHHMSPKKAKHIKEKNEEIKKWMAEHNSDVYPDYYIEIIRINTPEDQLKSPNKKDEFKKHGKRHGDFDGQRPHKKHHHDDHKPHHKNKNVDGDSTVVK